jgi:hypothetical protein
VSLWCEAFLITAITQTFAAVLNREARLRLSKLLQAKIDEKKSDFITYQKNKKKI